MGCFTSLIISQTIPHPDLIPLPSSVRQLCLSHVPQLESLCCNMTLGMKYCKICHVVTVLL